MRSIPRLNLTAALTLLLAAAPFATAQKYSYTDVEKKLGEKYSLTTVNAEGGVVTQGATLTLKKAGLTAGAGKVCKDEYKDGKIGPGGNIVEKAQCLRVPGAPAGGPVRAFVAGEKLYVTKIEVKDAIALTLISDPINDVTYKAELKFPLAKGTSPDPVQADQLIAEVFSAAAPDSAQGGQQAAQPAPAAAAPAPAALAPIAPPPPPQDSPALAPIAPPPPPPDAPAAPPQTLGLGMTVDQVVAILGQPQRVANVGNKQIYSYKDLKVTFVDGKVTDVQ
jgi:hypothetical protein